MGPSESQIQKQIMDYLALDNRIAWFSRNNVANGVLLRKDGSKGYIKTGKKGSADIIGMLKGGQFFAIEVKSVIGKLSTEQSQWIDKINKNGGVAIVARSFDDLKNIFREKK